jgi:hypothetical protein
VKKESIPHEDAIGGNDSGGALDSFSGMESGVALVSTALIFCHFCIKAKVRARKS